MRNPFKKEAELAPEKPKLGGYVAVEGKGPVAVRVSSSDMESASKETSIRGLLEKAHLIEQNNFEQTTSINPALAVKVSVSFASGYTCPHDFFDYHDYLDSYYYIPYVARALDIKQFMIWQMGYDLQCNDKASVDAVNGYLTDIQADTVFRDGTIWALVFGNMYWHMDSPTVFRPLNPMGISIKVDPKTQAITEYRYEPEFGKVFSYKPQEIIHLKFNPEPWGLFGTSALRRILPTIKALLFMEEKLPLIARRRADPLLEIQIGDKDNPVDEIRFKAIKNDIINRNPGEDLFHDGILKITEVYQSASVGGRQTVEPILDHFVRNLVAGLGVPEPALGFGGTTTMARARNLPFAHCTCELRDNPPRRRRHRRICKQHLHNNHRKLRNHNDSSTKSPLFWVFYVHQEN
jgi:hypothetical protein